jgi:hypothetical protein
MALSMAVVGSLPNCEFKKKLHYVVNFHKFYFHVNKCSTFDLLETTKSFQVYTSCFQILGGSLSVVINYHNPENKPKQGICVANHTSPIDVLILACDNAYALVSSSHKCLT